MMKTLCLILLPLSLAGASQLASDLKIAEVVIGNISVLDVTAGAWLAHRDVIVRDGKIAAVRPAGSPLPASKFTINGDGKFAIPGFFDNRVHLKGFDKATAGQFVAYGVTSVWDRGTDAAKTEEWRRDISYGKFMGPRIVRADAAGGPQNEPALPGSGAGAPSAIGRGFHDELAARVRQSGLTAAEVLRSATIDSARFHGRGLDLGSIEPGKIADLIVLSGDPLINITHTRTIDAVVFRGETLTRAHLNQLLSHAGLQPAPHEQ
jgi:predicted amidohydrolase YtcJ